MKQATFTQCNTPKVNIFILIIKKVTKSSLLTLLSLSILLMISGIVYAQDKDDKKEMKEMKDYYRAFDVSVHFKNMHTWHGFVVQPNPVIGTSFEYNSRNKKFTFGLWGGAGFGGDDVEKIDKNGNGTGVYVKANYKEVSIYTVFRFTDNFFIEAVSHNNYSGVTERGDILNYWSLDKTQTHNFIDINFGYNITPNTFLYLATILGGGQGDHVKETDGSTTDSWTHYLEVKSKVWGNEDCKISLFVGGAWSFFTEKTFYTKNSAGNVVNVGAVFNKTVNIRKYKLPVEVTYMWNPEQKATILQLDITLF